MSKEETLHVLYNLPINIARKITPIGLKILFELLIQMFGNMRVRGEMIASIPESYFESLLGISHGGASNAINRLRELNLIIIERRDLFKVDYRHPQPSLYRPGKDLVALLELHPFRKESHEKLPIQN